MDTQEQETVLLSIKSQQISDSGTPNTIELLTSGCLIACESGFHLRYAESELTGMEGTVTTLLIEKTRVTMHREGQFNTQMVFEEGHPNRTLYHTPYGLFEVSLHTKRLWYELSPSGGILEIEYFLKFDRHVTALNLLQVNVRPKPAD